MDNSSSLRHSAAAAVREPTYNQLSTNSSWEAKDLVYTQYKNPVIGIRQKPKGLYAIPLVFGIVIIVSFIVITVVATKYNNDYPNYEFGIVIDAGSTSSKVTLYKWQRLQKGVNTAKVEQEGETCKTKNAISSFISNPQNSSNEIIHCLTKTSPFKDLPDHIASSTSLFLGATAGMRMLNHRNPNASLAIFNSLRENLSSLKYSLPDPGVKVRIISGSEEAIYAWITVNYLKNVFDGQFKESNLLNEGKTFGALDMGGASTQIAVESFNNNNKIAGQLTNISLFNQQYEIYSYSFLCFGNAQIHWRVLANLLKDSQFNESIINPCGRPGDIMEVNPEDIFTAPCVTGTFANKSFGEEILPTSGNTIRKYRFIGSGDVELCRSKYIKPLFKTQQTSLVKPKIQGNFLAFSTYFYVSKALKLGTSTTLHDFQLATVKNCQSEQKESIDKRVSSFEKWYCFDAIYIQEILHFYNFTESDWSKLMFVDKISGSAVSWALGYMIDSSRNSNVKFVPQDPFVALSKFQFITIILVFSFILLFGIIGLIYGIKKCKAFFANATTDVDSSSMELEH